MPGRGTEKHARIHRADTGSRTRGRAGQRETRATPGERRQPRHAPPKERKKSEGRVTVMKIKGKRRRKVGAGKEGGKGREGEGCALQAAPARHRPLPAGRGAAGAAPPAGRHRRAPNPGDPSEPLNPGGPSEPPIFGVPPSPPNSVVPPIPPIPAVTPNPPPRPALPGPLLCAFSESGPAPAALPPSSRRLSEGCSCQAAAPVCAGALSPP